MKEGYENILERQRIVEEKMGEIEQQFEYSAEVFEHILVSLGQLSEELEGLKTPVAKITLPTDVWTSPTPSDWEPQARGQALVAETKQTTDS